MDKRKEGDLYKTITVADQTFEIRYGYYSDAERERWGPTPLFPNFLKHPQYTKDGNPYVTAEQTICSYYEPKQRVSEENWCHDCVHFSKGEELIGICLCREQKNNIRKNE